MRAFVVALAALAALTPAVAVARPMGFPDLRKTVLLSDPQISPDGTRIAFLLGRADYAKDRRDTQLMLFDLKTRRMRALTYDRTGMAEPRWSPDGSRIAFLASVKHDEKSDAQEQIFVLPMDGGEAHRISDAQNGVDDYAWSPDGKRFAYETQDTDPHKKAIEAHRDAFKVGDNDYLHDSATMPAHLWLVGAGGGKARQLTHGNWSVETFDPGGGADPSWSADGSTIAVVRYPTPLYGDSLGSVVELVNARTGKVTRLTHNDGLEGGAAFAPAGRDIAYVRNTDGNAMNGMAVYVTHAGGGNGIDVHAKIARNVNGMTWARDGKSLWLYTADGTSNAAWYVAADGSRVGRVDLNGVSVLDPGAAAKNGALAFIGATPQHQSELYYLPSPNAKPVRLTHVNDLPKTVQLGRVVPLRWRNGAFAEDGVVTLPPNYNPHRAYPLVLIVHGGPQGASTVGWSSQNQIFAGHGYIVFNPNYRGSTNLGDAYQRAITRDTGAGPGSDVMAGIAALKKAYKIDDSRIAVSGWSYGGYMTSWMIGHYHIWKAAVSGAALNDWVDDYNVAFYVHTDVPFFGGSPWDPKDAAMWRAQSPIANAPKVRTPTLIMGDLGDNNVTITNSFKMYHALKDNGVPVQFVAYPVHGHFPGDPVRSEDVMRRWLGWLDRYLR